MGVRPRREPDDESTITVWQEEGGYVAKDESAGVVSQGETKAEALENLADALELHERPVPEDAEEDLEPSTAPWF